VSFRLAAPGQEPLGFDLEFPRPGPPPGTGSACLTTTVMMVVTQFNNLRRELGFTGKKVLLLTVLGVLLGAVLALVIPMRVS
jgi:hypothetical protein